MDEGLKPPTPPHYFVLPLVPQKTKTHRQLFKIDNGFSHLLFLLGCPALRDRRRLVGSTPVTGATATAVKPSLATPGPLPAAATLPT